MKIGIITAMKKELEVIRAHMHDVKEYKHLGVAFEQGRLGDIDAVLTVCGIGTVNAALFTQVMIDRFKPDRLIHTGIAGGLNAAGKHLSVVVADALTYHDVRPEQQHNTFPYREFFPVDQELSDCLADAAGTEVMRGLILSGDAFVTDTAEKERLISRYPAALCVDMESCAVAHAAYINRVPVAVLRCISDLADGAASDDYDRFETLAAEKAADIVLTALSEL